MKNMFFFSLVFSVIISCGSSLAVTWNVELDGSGDYTIIQDAVDAAAEGDTIRLGAGRFLTVRPIPGWDGFSATVSIQKSGLVLIGAGPGRTVIGADSNLWEYHGIAVINGASLVQNCTLIGIAVDGGYNGVHYEANGLYVEACEFSQSFHGVVIANSDNCVVKDSYFHDLGIGAASYLSNGRFVVTNCQFQAVEYGISMVGVSDAQVSDCQISEVEVGIQFDLSRGTIQRCNVQGIAGANLGVSAGFTRGSQVMMNDCTLDHSMTNTYAALELHNGAVMSGHGNTIKGGGRTSVFVTGYALMGFHRNDIHKADSFCLTSRLYCEFMNEPLGQMDLSQNFWGTTDPAEVAEWIEDHHDHPNDSTYWMEVLVDPILPDSVPVEKKPLGGFKAMYR